MNNFYDWQQFVISVKGSALHRSGNCERLLNIDNHQKRAAALLKHNPEFDDMFRRNHPSSAAMLEKVLDHMANVAV